MKVAFQRPLDQSHQIGRGLADTSCCTACPRFVEHRLPICRFELIQRHSDGLTLAWAQVQLSGPEQVIHRWGRARYSTNTFF
ncbi:hypothetical protein A9978_08585 [Pseudomonas sp. UMC65]|nr:hypothetical protein [Pseudomonas sp. UMC65]MBB1622751.1 hypothetical protein [Pseudomonas sp. UME65]